MRKQMTHVPDIYSFIAIVNFFFIIYLLLIIMAKSIKAILLDREMNEKKLIFLLNYEFLSIIKNK